MLNGKLELKDLKKRIKNKQTDQDQKQTKQALIQHYVNLYRLYHDTNDGLDSKVLNNKTIQELKQAINSYQWMMNLELSY
jgi:hypothetical protein